MFKKESKKYQKEVIAKRDYPHCISVDWQRGAEFGYNKCKEEINKNGLALQSDMDKTIEQNFALKKKIEQMMCCANCVFSESDSLNGTFCHKEGCFVLASAKCKLWESE